MGNAFQVRALKAASRLMGRRAFCRWIDGYEPMPPAALAMVLEFLADMKSAAR